MQDGDTVIVIKNLPVKGLPPHQSGNQSQKHPPE
ncbi:MAG: PhnA domain-containing protein [Saprospiraceae bacterium]